MDTLARRLAWAALPLSSAVWAAHPLITEDAGTLGMGNRQFELNTDRAVERGSQLAGHAVNAALSYGVSDALDVAVNVPWQHDEVGGDPWTVQEGLGDASLYAKWRFYEQDKFSFAVKPIVYLPSGDSGRGLGNGRAGAGVVGIASWADQRMILSGNVGYTYNDNTVGDRRAIWSASGSAMFVLTEKLQAALELGAYRNSDPAAGKWPAFANFGLIYSPTASLDLDVGYLLGLNDAESLYSLGAGVTVRW